MDSPSTQSPPYSHHFYTYRSLSVSLSPCVLLCITIQSWLSKQSFWIWILQSVIIVAEPDIFLLLAPEEPSRRIIYLPQVNFMWSRFTCSLIFNSNSIFVTLKEFINHWLNFMLIGFQQINCVCESWYFYIFAFNLLIYDKLG